MRIDCISCIIHREKLKKNCFLRSTHFLLAILDNVRIVDLNEVPHFVQVCVVSISLHVGLFF